MRLINDPDFRRFSAKVRSIVGRILCLGLGLYGVRTGNVNPNEWNDLARTVSYGVGFLLLAIAVAP